MVTKTSAIYLTTVVPIFKCFDCTEQKCTSWSGYYKLMSDPREGTYYMSYEHSWDKFIFKFVCIAVVSIQL